MEVIVDRIAREQTARLMEAFAMMLELVRPLPVRVALKVKGRIVFIDPADCVSVQADGNYVFLWRASDSYMLREPICAVAKKLEPYGFIRIHRSVLVNTSFVEEIQPYSTGEYGIRMRGGKEYTVSREGQKNLRSLAAF